MTDYQKRISEKSIKAAMDFTDLINKSDIDPKVFARTLAREHRTLQQGAFRVMAACIEEWARMYEEGRFDDRNAGTCQASYLAWNKGEMKDALLPFI